MLLWAMSSKQVLRLRWRNCAPTSLRMTRFRSTYCTMRIRVTVEEIGAPLVEVAVTWYW